MYLELGVGNLWRQQTPANYYCTLCISGWSWDFNTWLRWLTGSTIWKPKLYCDFFPSPLKPWPLWPLLYKSEFSQIFLFVYTQHSNELLRLQPAFHGTQPPLHGQPLNLNICYKKGYKVHADLSEASTVPSLFMYLFTTYTVLMFVRVCTR